MKRSAVACRVRNVSLCGCVFATVAGFLPAQQNQSYRNTAGTVRTFSQNGDIDLSSPFFQTLGTNCRRGLSEIWLRDLASGRSTRLLATEGVPRLNPRIDQDGSTVVYMIVKDGKGLLCTMPLSGGLARRVCGDCGNVWSWTRSGSVIHSVGTTAAADRRIMVFDPKTAANRLLLENALPRYQISFSPDEKWIAFVQLPAGVNRSTDAAAIL